MTVIPWYLIIWLHVASIQVLYVSSKFSEIENRFHRDIALRVPITIQDLTRSSVPTYTTYSIELYHDEIYKWESIIENYAKIYSIDSQDISRIHLFVREKLLERGYRLENIDDIMKINNKNSKLLTSVDVIQLIIDSILSSIPKVAEYNVSNSMLINRILNSSRVIGQRYLTDRQEKISTNGSNHHLLHDLYSLVFYADDYYHSHQNLVSMISKSFQNIHKIEFDKETGIIDTNSEVTVTDRMIPTFIIYQNKNSYTGGTTALLQLAQQLDRLGYNTLLCNDTNRESFECTHPHKYSIVITGEWCKGALEDYGIYKFKGRAVQYHLGFHHMDDSCKGHVTITHSHYYKQSLAHRILGAYYLGCPMTEYTRDKHSYLLHQALSSSSSSPSPSLFPMDKDNSYQRVVKEDLIIVDPDFIQDYPPETSLEVLLPSNYKVVYAKGIPHDEFVTILQRAKVVVDLAMPGAERVAGEGILMGAMPIVSSLWNGASSIDFPGILKVNPHNATDIIHGITTIITNYSNLLSMSKYYHNNQVIENRMFYSYIISLWQRLQVTADLYFGSSRLHFIVMANSIQEEYLTNLQILGLLHMFPLCSIDYYVYDVGWYTRHHYSYFSMLKDSGYIRMDRFDPKDNTDEDEISYIQIKSFPQLKRDLMNKQLDNLIDHLFPPWKPISIYLSNGWIPSNPMILLKVFHRLRSSNNSSDNPSDAIFLWNQRQSMNSSNILGFVFYPYDSIERNKILLTFTAIIASINYINPSDKSVISITISKEDKMELCDLYHWSNRNTANTSHDNDDDDNDDITSVCESKYGDISCNLIGSIAWIRTINYIRIMNFRQENSLPFCVNGMETVKRNDLH